MKKYLIVNETDNGAWLELTKNGKEEIVNHLENPEMVVLNDLTEYNQGNENFRWVQPEEVGALTDSPIFSTDYEYIDDDGDEVEYHNIYWFPDYAVISIIEELYKNGKVFFEKRSFE